MVPTVRSSGFYSLLPLLSNTACNPCTVRSVQHRRLRAVLDAGGHVPVAGRALPGYSAPIPGSHQVAFQSFGSHDYRRCSVQGLHGAGPGLGYQGSQHQGAAGKLLPGHFFCWLPGAHASKGEIHGMQAVSCVEIRVSYCAAQLWIHGHADLSSQRLDKQLSILPACIIMTVFGS
jgi:hypothetical protein